MHSLARMLGDDGHRLFGIEKGVLTYLPAAKILIKAEALRYWHETSVV